MSVKLSQVPVGILLASALLFPAALSFASAAADQHQPTARTYRISGVVKAIAPDAVTLAHDPVPALQWPAMTMPFALAKGLTPGPLKIGQPALADVSQVNGRYVITAISPRG